MRRNDVFPSPWLAATDLPEGDTVLTIAEVKMEKLKDPKTQKEDEKPVIFFQEDDVKPMVCNVTNWKQIEKATGCEDSEEWAGKKVTLFTMEVEAFGELRLAIRVRGNAPTKRPLAIGKAIPPPKAPTMGKPTSEQEAADTGADEQVPF